MTWRGYQPDRSTRFWTVERVDRLAQLRCVEGRGFDEISKLLGSTPIAAKRQAEIHGLTLTPQAWAIKRLRRNG
jgi:hypothetical protein